MQILKIANTVFTSNTWIIKFDNSVWIVDCGDVDSLLPLLQASSLKGILLTHGHYDHIYGLNDMCRCFSETQVYCSEWTKRQLLDEKLNLSYYHETPFVFAFPERITVVEDGDELELCDDITVRAVATPGHTPGCITWMTDDALFTGDAYIPGARVVTTLPFGDKQLATRSLELIRSLAQYRKIFSGHSVAKCSNNKGN